MMKKYMVFALAMLVVPAFAEDADKKKDDVRKDRRAEMIKKYDKDGDGKLSEEERKAMMEDRKKAREAREKDGKEPRDGKRGSRDGRGKGPKQEQSE